MSRKKITTRTLLRRRESDKPIVMVTAYDATFARIFDDAGVDVMLVGDSVGCVVQGYESTIHVTMDQMVYHTQCVMRGVQYAHVVADLPFGAYGGAIDVAVENAARLMKEGGAHAVKLEGGRAFAELVYRLTSMGIPVMGHLGYTPQSHHQIGGHYVQGRGDSAQAIIDDAIALQEAGAYAIVLELVPAEVAQRVTAALRIPTIGIGAGNQTSGQVLVCYDMLGMDSRFSPKFLKRFATLESTIKDAVTTYVDEVRDRSFPDADHAFE